MRIGLRLQQALYIFLVSIVISSMITVFAVLNQKQTIEYEFLVKGRSLAHLLSATLVSPLYELKVDQIDRLLSHVLDESDIKRTFVLDQEGYILADGTEDNLFSDELVHDIIPNMPTGNIPLRDMPLEKNKSHLILSPVLDASGEYLGALVIELSLERANTEVQKFLYKMAFISIVATILALVLAYIVASFLVMPLKELKRVTEDITKGNYGARLNSHRKDELGDLSNAIDNMAANLNRTTVSKDYLDRIIHDMPNGLMILDHQGRIKQTNTYISTLFSLSSNDLLGQIFTDLCHQILQDETAKKLSKEQLKSKFAGECSILINGDAFPVNLAITEIKQSNDHTEILVMLHDIRQQKILESERETALVKAEESAQLKSEFLASMSHEIRTPMNGVLGLLRLLLNEPLTEHQKHYVTLALSSADTLLTLINDILDFSKIEADKLSLEEVDFNIGALLGDFSESIAHRAQEKGLELVLDQSGITQSHVKGDPNRFKQILTNLVGNAIKFTSSGEVVIQASMEALDNKYLRCSFSISDTGVGIAKDKIDSLFDAFVQADASTTRKYGGTGLGLAIANRLCLKMSNNPIQVESIIGEGSCFKFDLDFSISPQSNTVIPEVALEQVNILIVDDNQHSSQAITNQLSCWEANVMQVADGERALRLLQAADTFQIVIIDRDMPYMDGCELAKAIHDDAKLKTKPLIMMTSIKPHDGENNEYFSNIGVCTSFPKPATLSDLSNATALALKSKQTQTEMPTAPPSSQETDHIELAQARILLVDDVMVNQLIGATLLKEYDCIVDVAENGIEALGALNKPSRNNSSSSSTSSPYQLILMDCQMPEMDGYEATRQIRASAGGSQYAQIPIIAMTANAMKGDKEHCLEAGMNDYISKPIDPDTLIEKVKYWLNCSG